MVMRKRVCICMIIGERNNGYVMRMSNCYKEMNRRFEKKLNKSIVHILCIRCINNTAFILPSHQCVTTGILYLFFFIICRPTVSLFWNKTQRQFRQNTTAGYTNRLDRIKLQSISILSLRYFICV